MMLKCPSNCRHPYLFQHSVIATEREVKASDGSLYRVTSVYIVCRECGHWIDSNPKCRCPFKCHEEIGGTDVSEPRLIVVS
jgi:hypothetical protein